MYLDFFLKRVLPKLIFYCFLSSLFSASCLSYVPEKGTVGASGDLAPLSHLALGLMGEGKMWSPKSGWAEAKYVSTFSLDALVAHLCPKDNESNA